MDNNYKKKELNKEEIMSMGEWQRIRIAVYLERKNSIRIVFVDENQ